MTARWPRLSFYVVMVLAILADQSTKQWAVLSLRPIRSVTIFPGCLDLTYVQNRGIAFGMFAGQGLFIAFFIVGLVLLTLYFSRGLNWAGWEPNLTGGCLCGGALGNLLDRFRQGYVVDFFDAYLGNYHWPVFNLADSLICLSVAWIVFRQLFGPDQKTVTQA